MPTRTPAHALLDAVTARDFAALKDVLTAETRVRALLPTRQLDLEGPEEIVTEFLGWFGTSQRFRVLTASVEPVADRFAVRYRVGLERQGTPGVIEQQLFCTAANGHITAIDLVCSGFLPVPDSSTRDFDAGQLGCADGLAAQFKHRISEIVVGDLLRVHTSDPSAKEDLPSLARLMGHVVHSIEARSDGGLTITVERGR